MENRIGPIVQNLSDLERGLSPSADHRAEDPAFAAMRKQLNLAAEEQKVALNVISGFVETYQLGALQNSSLDNPAAERVFLTGPSMQGGRGLRGDGAPFAANAVYNAGISGAPGSVRMPMFDISYAGLGHDPFAPFAQAIIAARTKEKISEATLAKILTGSLRTCRSE